MLSSSNSIMKFVHATKSGFNSRKSSLAVFVDFQGAGGTICRENLKNEDHYSLTWHIVPAKHLSFEAVISPDILEQASLKFTQDSIEFQLYEGDIKMTEKAFTLSQK
ncbi:hypothetical protein NPIL_291321 [Nephila pilipes]|uniref:Uncharacterized protein n=1 Tax=Nephila pilipes TaxID=299642 RepID=A0A8X6T9D3_NEPPI|nr:hypothetical protein NPIL_291321 [Nephila pilipes]